MKIVPFRIGHLDHLDYGAFERANMNEVQEFRRVIDKLPGPAKTLMDGDEPVGAFGIVVTGREGWSWAAFSDDLRDKPFALHRLAKRELAAAMKEYGLDAVHGTLAGDWSTGRQWLEKLGFEPSGNIETEFGKLERFTKWAQAQP